MFEPHKIYDDHFFKIKQSLTDEEILQVVAFANMLVAESIGKEVS